MSPGAIKTIDDLKCYLHRAMQLEHATIPPYLTALYSIKPNTNPDAVHVIRTVVVEEMLHLTIVANLLNAIGGEPDLTAPDFVPSYPTYLPDGDTSFKVHLQPFSKDAISTFLKIEQPTPRPANAPRSAIRAAAIPHSVLGSCPINPDVQYHSIGAFYEEIEHGIAYLVEAKGNIFTGDPKRQVTSEYYYSGGGKLNPIIDAATAQAGLHLIVEQGEGDGGKIFDKESELAHFYRFQELFIGKFYQPHNQPGEPTGPDLKIDWNAVYPLKCDAKLTDYRGEPELHDAAVAFNSTYRDYLQLLTNAFNGRPNLLLQAVPWMFEIRNKMVQLIHNPLPGSEGLNAAPTFETYEMAEAVS